MLPRIGSFGVKRDTMTDFQKALGILNKAKQGSLFAKRKHKTFLKEGNHHPDVLGHTRSGKVVRDAKFGYVDDTSSGALWRQREIGREFLAHHKDWTDKDHDDALNIHYEHSDHARITHAAHKVAWNRGANPQIDNMARSYSLGYSADHHYGMGNAHRAAVVWGKNASGAEVIGAHVEEANRLRDQAHYWKSQE